MNYYTERLNNELIKILNYWIKYAIKDSRIAPEINNDGIANYQTPLGSVYVSRILFGSSAAIMHLKDRSFLPLAEIAFKTLTTQLYNPKGGYLWGINPDGTILHDEMSVSFAQPFVLYGLSEYYALTGNEQVGNLIREQVDFIEKKLSNKHDGGYIDGFTYGWNATENQIKSLGTHLHLLEAYTKIRKITKDIQYNILIEKLIEIILKHFINLKVTRVIHQFDKNWAPLRDENWIGHNLETSWILCDAARTINNQEQTQKCKEVALKLCDKAIELGFDSQYGGMFSRFDKEYLLTTDKEWWPQAESVIAFLNAYSLSGDKKYLSFAIRILEYIDNTFSNTLTGEWYDSVSREGKPYIEKPRVHFWKSMFHNVRYCIETTKYLEKLFAKTYSLN
jgi:mannobiose 2-epimerase